MKVNRAILVIWFLTVMCKVKKLQESREIFCKDRRNFPYRTKYNIIRKSIG